MLVFLLTLADEKDQELIRKLYARYNGFMLKTARRLLKGLDHENFELDCEDAVQNAYMKIMCSVRFPMTVSIVCLQTMRKSKKNCSPQLNTTSRKSEMQNKRK